MQAKVLGGSRSACVHCVCVVVRVLNFLSNELKQIGLVLGTEATVGLSYIVLEQNSCISKNKAASFWSFVPNSKLSLFRHITSIVASAVNFDRLQFITLSVHLCL